MSKKTVLAALGFSLCLVLPLAACGGGGSGTPGPGPSPSVGPSPLPSGSPHPAADTDTFAFSGSSTKSVQRFRPTPTPPVQVIPATVTLNQTVHTAQTFHGVSATDFQSTETDTTPNQTITVNSDNFVQLPAATGNLLDLGFRSTDSNGATVDENLTSSNDIIDQLPEAPGASWSNTAAAVIAQTAPDGTTLNETIAADGSYSETILNPSIGTTTVTQNADGSGTLDTPSTVFFQMGTGTHVTLSAVSANQITLTVASVGVPPPSPAPIVGKINAWFPATPMLATDQFTDLGADAMPSGCDAATFGARGIHLREVRTRLDTILGTNETGTIDTWIVPGAGPACIQTSDNTNLYYDFTGQTVNGIYASTPAQTTTLAELIGLRSETIHAMAKRAATATAAQLGSWPLAIGRNRLDLLQRGLRLRQALALRHLALRKGFTR